MALGVISFAVLLIGQFLVTLWWKNNSSVQFRVIGEQADG